MPLHLNVLIIAHDPLARAGLAAIFAQDDDINIIGQVSPDTDDLSLFAADVLLMDMGWEWDEDSTAHLQQNDILEQRTPLVLLIPDAESALTLAQLLTASTLPAYGLLVRNAPHSTLSNTLQAVSVGVAVTTPDLMTTLVQQTDSPDTPTLDVPLTPREQEVLNLLAEGLPNKRIAQQLHISEYTVKYHVNAILSKLNVGSRTEAVIRATRLGLVSL